MDAKRFAEGIKYLKSIYTKWDFDTSSTFTLDAWYRKFKDLTDEEWISLVTKYTDNEKYPPSSPFDLLSYVRSKTNGEQAYENIINLNKEYPVSNDYYKPQFYQKLREDEIAYQVFDDLDMETYLVNYDKIKDGTYKYVSDSIFILNTKNYYRDHFIRQYNELAKPSKLLEISGTSERKMIGNAN